MIPDKDVIAHYASPYYDPEKAHEYYMKNRELKGRNSSGTSTTDNTISTSKLNDEGKAIWTQVKGNIKDEKKAVKKQIDAQRDAQIAELKKKTGASQEKMFAKLEKLQNAFVKKKGSFDKAAKSSFSKEKASRELTATIQALRQSYALYKKQTDESYTAIFQSEFNKIMAEYPTTGKRRR